MHDDVAEHRTSAHERLAAAKEHSTEHSGRERPRSFGPQAGREHSTTLGGEAAELGEGEGEKEPSCEPWKYWGTGWAELDDLEGLGGGGDQGLCSAAKHELWKIGGSGELLLGRSTLVTLTPATHLSPPPSP